MPRDCATLDACTRQLTGEQPAPPEYPLHVAIDDTAETAVWALRAPGTYLLLLRLAQPVRLAVGRLGPTDLPAGWYVYVGSALGGLGPRLRRHARLEKRHHWHVDALRGATQLEAIAVRVGRERLECGVAATIAAQPGAARPIPRFGSSDCRCPSHLLHFPSRPDLSVGPEWRVWTVPGDNQGLGPGEAGGSGVASAGTGW